NALLSPLRSIPGPWYCASTGIVYLWKISTSRHLAWIKDLHDKYGPIVRARLYLQANTDMHTTAPNMVNVRDVNALQAIFSTHRFAKSPFYSVFDLRGNPTVFSARDPTIAKMRRKLVIPMFTRTAVDDMDEMIMSAGIRPLLRRLMNDAASGNAANLMQL
ncbi:cytochrome P450, partial [Thamnocephalis sphaerospora]